ncbi:hypothetical protein A9Q79_00785 [Methylophaga sp. 42_25_T18]|nr:hypothetical protein A9Q79_00785 [Methylophaga sp. 42_25_T18]
MNIVSRNIIIFIVALLIPVAAQFYSLGSGFDILLYEPCDFAYILLIGAILFYFNISIFTAGEWYWSTSLSLLLWALWFTVTFLVVGQLNLSLGGKL